MNHNHLKGIRGKQIRRQYFNFHIYIIVAIYFLVIEMTASVPLT